MTTPTPTTAAPDPVRVAREAVAATRYGEQDKAAVLNGERDKYPAMELALVGARAMQEAMAQGGEVAPYEAAYRHVKECLHRAEDRAQSAEDALGKVEDLLAEFGAEAPAIIGEYLGERRHAISLARPAPEVKDAPGFERCADCGGSGMYWAGEGVRPCPECKGDTVVPTTPAPAASDELVERARAQNAIAIERYGMSIPVLVEMAARIEELEHLLQSARNDGYDLAKDEYRARIEAGAAEMERLRAELADYNDERTRDLSAALERAATAEAERDALREKLTEIATAYTAHGYSDAMDAVQTLKDTAKEALK